MAVRMQCPCGKRWLVADEKIGRATTCPLCGLSHEVPKLETDGLELQPPSQPSHQQTGLAESDDAPPVPAGVQDASLPVQDSPVVGATPASFGPRRTLAVPPSQPPAGWRYRYLFLSIVLLPSLLSLFNPNKEDDELEKRLAQTIQHQLQAAPPAERQRIVERLEAVEAKEARTLDDYLNALPERRLDGAFLPRGTWAHWGFAGLSAAGFFLLLLLLFPRGDATTRQLLLCGLFTGTLGIFLLLAFQFIALITQGFWLKGGGVVTLIFYIVKFIGFSYRSALDPSNGFLLSCMGFTCGVGLCEELCKALPLLWHYRRPRWRLDWRGAGLWGLASGIGFGVSEGITYSSDFYNGVTTYDIYVIRFVSCVGLHAIWSAAVGVMMARRQEDLRGNRTWLELALALLRIIAVPMVLHGLYDTLLKQEHEALAFLTAVGSFAWLAYQIELARRGAEAPAPVSVPA